MLILFGSLISSTKNSVPLGKIISNSYFTAVIFSTNIALEACNN